MTEVVEFTVFHRAEQYHQAYDPQNLDQPYCQVVIAFKVAKARKVFFDGARNRWSNDALAAYA